MIRRRRRDLKHFAIIRDLKRLGFSVADASLLGDDFPDLCIGAHGITALVELKTIHTRARKTKTYTYKGEQSEGQREFAAAWRGSAVIVAYSLDDVLTQFAAQLKRQKP